MADLQSRVLRHREAVKGAKVVVGDGVASGVLVGADAGEGAAGAEDGGVVVAVGEGQCAAQDRGLAQDGAHAGSLLGAGIVGVEDAVAAELDAEQALGVELLRNGRRGFGPVRTSDITGIAEGPDPFVRGAIVEVASDEVGIGDRVRADAAVFEIDVCDAKAPGETAANTSQRAARVAREAAFGHVIPRRLRRGDVAGLQVGAKGLPGGPVVDAEGGVEIAIGVPGVG
ncbi:hypothetical protein GCM10023165_53390 [Variovorax defluvii]|uniref:Uncharacterized protein n=1 Tax=Variovorax defluvii TaxID=913761 RepID=A0ABP8IGK6_9BURK